MKIAGVPISGGGGATITKLTNQTLASGSWTTSGSYYIYSFSNANITPTTQIDFTPYNESTNDAISSMNFYHKYQHLMDHALFYSSFLPENNMIGDITISTTV
jgi:hypothetical protein